MIMIYRRCEFKVNFGTLLKEPFVIYYITTSVKNFVVFGQTVLNNYTLMCPTTTEHITEHFKIKNRRSNTSDGFNLIKHN
nr:MAG TPA: hypothetical protein [Caudoviricetes sp.]